MGLGTQDDLALAEDFVARTGTTSFRMLWDPTFHAWAQLGVVSQPAWMLFTPSGEIIDGVVYGGIDTQDVLRTVASL